MDNEHQDSGPFLRENDPGGIDPKELLDQIAAERKAEEEKENPPGIIKRTWRRVSPFGRKQATPQPTIEETLLSPEVTLTREQAELIAGVVEVYSAPEFKQKAADLRLFVKQIEQGNIAPFIEQIASTLPSYIAGLQDGEVNPRIKRMYLLQRLEALVQAHRAVLSPTVQVNVLGSMHSALSESEQRILQKRATNIKVELMDMTIQDLETARIRLRAAETQSRWGEQNEYDKKSLREAQEKAQNLELKAAREEPERRKKRQRTTEVAAQPLLFLLERIKLIDPTVWKGHLGDKNAPHPLAVQIREELQALGRLDIDTKIYLQTYETTWKGLQERAERQGEEYKIHPPLK